MLSGSGGILRSSDTAKGVIPNLQQITACTRTDIMAGIIVIMVVVKFSRHKFFKGAVAAVFCCSKALFL